MIYLLGDIGHYNKPLKDLTDNMKRVLKPKDRIILLGDNFYPMGVKSINDPQWQHFKRFFNVDNKIYSVLGNHDYQLNPYAQIQFKHRNYSMKDWYYKKTFNNIDFFFLDTTQLVTMGWLGPGPWGNVNEALLYTIFGKDINQLRHEQLSWLENKLAGSDKVKIVIGHYPIVTYGSHAGDTTDQLYKLLFPIFKKYKVKAYFCGHDHNIQHIISKKGFYKLHNIIGGSSSSLYEASMISNKNYFYGKTPCLLRLNPSCLKVEVLDKTGVIKSIQL